jgi:hypothetical protein
MRRRLSMRWRPLWRLRLRLARLRRLRLRWLWLLLVMGTLRRLLKGTHGPQHNKSPSQHCATGRGSTVLACPPYGGQLVFALMLAASQCVISLSIASATRRNHKASCEGRRKWTIHEGRRYSSDYCLRQACKTLA